MTPACTSSSLKRFIAVKSAGSGSSPASLSGVAWIRIMKRIVSSFRWCGNGCHLGVRSR